jgi:hypothetical protein
MNKNYTRVSVIKEAIEQSETMKRIKIKNIIFLGRDYNDCGGFYEQTFLVVGIVKCSLCDDIPVLYRAVWYEDCARICFSPYKMVSNEEKWD